MEPTLTLVNLSCAKACRHCAYGAVSPVAYERVRALAEDLVGRGRKVQLYDMNVTRRSLEIFRVTRQYERGEVDWLNVNPEFDPSDDECAYLNGLRVSLVLSLHGSRPEVHTLVSGRDDYVTIVAAFARLRPKLTTALGVNYVVHRQNVDDIPAFAAFAFRTLRADFIEFINLGYGGRAPSTLGAEFALDEASFRRAYAALCAASYRFSQRVQLDSQWGPDFAGYALEACRLFASPVPSRYCNAGVNHFAVRTDDLRIFACPSLVAEPSQQIGVLRDGELVLERDFVVARERLSAPCAGCDRLARCAGGPRCIALADARRCGVDDPQCGFKGCLYAAHCESSE